MHISINHQNVQMSDTLEEHVRDRVASALSGAGREITRVEVHLGDESSPKKHTPNDKRCLIEVRPAGRPPMVVEDHGDTFYAAVSGSASKLKRVVESRLRPTG